MPNLSRRPLVPALFVLVGGMPQAAGAIDVVAGARAGWTLTDLAGANDEGAGSRQAAVLGGVVGWEFNPTFSLRVEPGWTQKGCDLDNFDTGDLTSAVRLSYFEIPVLARFKHAMEDGSGGGAFAVVGPSFAISTSSNLIVAGGDENISEHVKGFDFGLAFGAGLDLAAEKGIVSFEARYVIGLSDAFESSAPQQSVTSDLSNRALQITVSWWGRIH